MSYLPQLKHRRINILIQGSIICKMTAFVKKKKKMSIKFTITIYNTFWLPQEMSPRVLFTKFTLRFPNLVLQTLLGRRKIN